MLTSLFRSSQPFALFLLPLITAALWLPGLIDPQPVSVEHAMPLYQLCASWMIDMPLTASIAGAVLVLGGALLVNFLVNAHEVLPRQTYLPALCYVVLMSCAPQQLTLHPLLFANIFLLLATHKLMNTYRRDTAFAQVFDAGFLISVGVLFYFPTIVLFPVIWVGLAVLRPFIWREWVISLLGLAVPFLFVCVYYFWYDQLEYLWEDKVKYPIINRFFQFTLTVPFIALLVMLGWVFLLSAGKLVTGIRVSKLKTKNSLLLLVWLSFFSAVSMLLAPMVSVTYYSFLAVPLAVFFANYLLLVKRQWWGELVFWMLAAAIVFNHMALVFMS
jgi:hypothetical protein